MGFPGCVVDAVEDLGEGAVDLVSDGADAVGDAVVDVAEVAGTAIVDGVEWVVDAAGNLLEKVVDAAEDIAEAAAKAAEAAAEATAAAAAATWTAAQDTFDAATSAASAVLDPVLDNIVSPVGDVLLGGLEDSGFFDVVDYASLGIIDMDYQSGQGFTLDFGIADVAGYNLNIGNGGFAVSGQYGGQSLGISANDDGYGASAALGIDWGPLPYTVGHASVQADGDVGAGGEWQGYFPLPGVMVGGHTSADYQETDDGFQSSWDVTPGVYEPTGEYAGVGTHGSYSEDKDGYQFNVGVHAEAGQAGVVEARGSLDYNEARRGDVRTQGVSASASVEDQITHTKVEGTLGYQHTETSDGDYDTVYAQGKVSGEGFEVGGQVAGTVGPRGQWEVEGSGYVDAAGYRVAADGEMGEGPDGFHASGDVDELDTPFGSPDDLPSQVPGFGDLPDGFAPQGFPDELPAGLPDGFPSGVPSFDQLPDSVPDPQSFFDNALDQGRQYAEQGQQYVDQAVDQGRQYVDRAVDQGEQYVDQAVDQGRQYVEQATDQMPSMPTTPSSPDSSGDDLPF